MAQANHRAAQVAVDQTLIRAPFEGVVLTKNANVGDVITPFSSATGSQAAVVTMADMSTLEVEADVAESNSSKVQPEQPCEIQLDALPDARLRGRAAPAGADRGPLEGDRHGEDPLRRHATRGSCRRWRRKSRS